MKCSKSCDGEYEIAVILDTSDTQPCVPFLLPDLDEMERTGIPNIELHNKEYSKVEHTYIYYTGSLVPDCHGSHWATSVA